MIVVFKVSSIVLSIVIVVGVKVFVELFLAGFGLVLLSLSVATDILIGDSPSGEAHRVDEIRWHYTDIATGVSDSGMCEKRAFGAVGRGAAGRKALVLEDWDV